MQLITTKTTVEEVAIEVTPGGMITEALKFLINEGPLDVDAVAEAIREAVEDLDPLDEDGLWPSDLLQNLATALNAEAKQLDAEH